MNKEKWSEGRESTTWALEYAESQDNKMTKPTVINLIEVFSLGMKIGGRWKVDVYRWKKHIATGTDFTEEENE